MAGATVKVTLDELDRRISDLARSLESPGRLLDNIGVQLVSTTTKRFTEQKAPDGSAWTPLAPLTREIKGGTRILQDSGRLMQSISHTVEGNVLHVGTNLVYGRTHQEGKKITAKNVKMLAIPLSRRARRIRPRELGLICVRSEHGNPILALPRKRGLVAMYLLKRSVTIPKREFLGYSREDHELVTGTIVRRYVEEHS